MEKTMIVQLSILDTKIEEFMELTKIMVKKSNAEIGCLVYKLLKSLEEENSFFIYEKYKNQKALDAHKTSKHLEEYTNAVLPLLIKEPIIETF